MLIRKTTLFKEMKFLEISNQSMNAYVGYGKFASLLLHIWCHILDNIKGYYIKDSETDMKTSNCNIISK